MLAAGPLTISQLAFRLGIPRQLVHYHVKHLQSEGLIRVKDVVKTGRGVSSKAYLLKQGAVLAVADPYEVEKVSAWLEHYYVRNVRNMSKKSRTAKNPSIELPLFFYHLMRLCSNPGIDAGGLFRLYGERFAEDVIIKNVHPNDSKGSGFKMFEKALLLFKEFAYANLAMKNENGLIQFRTFLGSGAYDTRVDEFIHSVLRRLVNAYLGDRFVVQKFPPNGRTYSYIIKRTGVKEL